MMVNEVKTFISDETIQFGFVGIKMKQKVKLKDIASYSKGQQINGDKLLKDGIYDYLNGGIYPSGKWHSYNVDGNTITISEGGNSSGYVNYMNQPFWCGAHCYYLFDTVGDIKYLYYALKSQQERIMKIRSGACMPNIKKVDLGNFEFLFDDDRLVQHQVVEILDKICCIINQYKCQLVDLDKLIKSRFVEMFGDPISNPMGWNKKPFLDMGECKNGMNFHQDDAGIEIHCLGVGDFKDLTLIDDVEKLPMVSLNEMPSEEYLLKDGDIVFVRSNGNKALVGRSLAVYPDDVPTTFSGFCIRYRKTDDAISIPYLLRVLKTESMRQKMVGRGANIQNLNQQILRALEIPVPPIELQNQFATFVRQTDKLKDVEQKRLEKLQLLFDSLMQKYFG
ncbi:MAG: restriction endonuclease subunit S [Lachnospiraceae bacterium]|nr:restriction endonuclease subunit S [Lachnospiraceae bacterium]